MSRPQQGIDYITVRLSADLKKKFEDAASDLGMPVSKFVRLGAQYALQYRERLVIDDEKFVISRAGDKA